jgi:hypothetical protein
VSDDPNRNVKEVGCEHEAQAGAANGESDSYPEVVSTPAKFGRDLRRSTGRLDRIGEDALEVGADGSPARRPPRGGTVSRIAYRSSGRI